LGEPLRPDAAELQNMHAFRIQLARPGDPPHKNIGEAETLAIMVNRNMYESRFVTDDHGAMRLAKANKIAAVSTCDLLKLAVRVNLIDADTCWGYVEVLRRNERGLPAEVDTRPSFVGWLNLPGG
jgi:hypothetical protein